MYKLAPFSILLCLSLIACSLAPVRPPVLLPSDTKFVREPVPANLVAPTPYPEPTGSSCLAHIQYNDAALGAIDRCNADKRSIIEWADGLNK